MFADDVRNQTVDGKDLQLEADVLCAFCFVFGLRLNSKKTEMFIKNYGGEKDITDQKEIKLKIMDEEEMIILMKTIVLQKDGRDKHLGITHDNERNGTITLREEVMNMLDDDCRKVRKKSYIEWRIESIVYRQ